MISILIGSLREIGHWFNLFNDDTYGGVAFLTKTDLSYVP